MTCRWLTGPTFLAAIVTLANAAKPVVVDDTAYLLFARQISHQPLDPYGFSLFWYNVRDPAMHILLPPVLPYWLGLGIAIFGENVPLLKLWMFPFAWLLAWSLQALLRLFARGVERPMLVMLMFSPAVLPTINLMLDIPAIALGLAALVIFLKACEEDRKSLAVLSGFVLALAVQTKYTMLVMPGVLVWAGIVNRRITPTLLAIATAALTFTLWEFLLYQKYGVSHFVFHALDQQQSSNAMEKWALVPPLFAFLGLTAGLLAFWASRPLGVPRWAVNAAAALALVGVVLVVFFPFPDMVLVPGSRPGREKLTMAALVWRSLGGVAAITTILAAGTLLLKRGPRLRRSRDSYFILGWLAIELAAYFALTPFPAGRRVIGLTIVAGLLLARAVSRLQRIRHDRAPLRWVVPAAIVTGCLFSLLDAYDASAEKTAIRRVTEVIRDRGFTGRVWFAGHWGTQYYGEQAGLTQYVPEKPPRSGPIAQPGDWVVLPEFPDAEGFYRPYTGGEFEWYQLDVPKQAEVVARIVVEDALSGMTVPNFYGGVDPIASRSRPRLVLTIYRLKQPWRPW